MVLILDNYDSFTYNLAEYLRIIGAHVQVMRNNAVTITEIAAMHPEKIVISPGPGRPEGAGICLHVIREFAADIPLLGVCLGHQAIGMCYGGTVINARRIMHGKTSMITADGKTIYKGLHELFQAMRYHSLVLSREKFPDCLAITAESDDGEIMGVRHRDYPVEGIQFHPESIMTPVGKRILRNFVNL